MEEDNWPAKSLPRELPLYCRRIGYIDKATIVKDSQQRETTTIFILELHQLALACDIKGFATKRGNAIVQPREVCACHR